MTSLGAATEKTARLIEQWRDLLEDEQYVVLIEILHIWLSRERGRVRYAWPAATEWRRADDT